MNRGSALKWIEALGNCEEPFDNAQIAIDIHGARQLSPVGVLCSFLDPNGFTLIPTVSAYSWHGEFFYLPREWMKKIKAKTEDFDAIYADVDKILVSAGRSLEENYSGAFIRVAEYVRENYERF